MSVKNEDGQYPYLMIGEELRYLLKASGVSLKMIADHAGMSNTTIQTLLKGGSVKISVLIRWYKAMKAILDDEEFELLRRRAHRIVDKL